MASARPYYLVLVIALIGPSVPTEAQVHLYPGKHPVENTSLRSFLQELGTAVADRNAEFILDHLSNEVKNSFGGDGGIEEFKEYWDWENGATELWLTLERILALGGGIYDGSTYYSMPFVFSDWPGHDELDAFEHYLVTGMNVNVRNSPGVEGSEVTGKLSWEIVKVDYDRSEIVEQWDQRLEDRSWYLVTTTDGRISGYVRGDYVYSPVGYRIGIMMSDGQWIITFLLAGD